MGKKKKKKDVETPEISTAELVSVETKPNLFPSAEDTAEGWCRRVVGLNDGHGQAPAKVRLEVRQTRHEKYSKLLEIPMGAQSPNELAIQVQEEAERSGYKDVRVSAFYPNARLPFTSIVLPCEDFMLDDEEDETGAGLSASVVRQAVRHNEVMMASMMGMQVAVMRHLGEQNKQLSENSEKLASERLGLIELVRKIKIDSLEDEERVQRNNALTTAGKTLVDAVAFRLTDGQGGNNAREEIMSRMLTGLGESLSEEQSESLRKVLNAEQIVTLSELFKDPKAHADAVAKEIEKTEKKQSYKKDDG